MSTESRRIIYASDYTFNVGSDRANKESKNDLLKTFLVHLPNPDKISHVIY